MKFWRIFAAVAVVGMLVPPQVAVADDDDDDDDVGVTCEKNTELVEDCSLVICPEFYDDTNEVVGNVFPWANDPVNYDSYRNQFLYTSNDIAAIALTMNGISARASSFASASTVYYGDVSVGLTTVPSSVLVYEGLGSLSNVFDDNYMGAPLCVLTGTDATPIIMGTDNGPKGSMLSVCESCVGADVKEKNNWCSGLPMPLPAGGLLVDTRLELTAGSSGSTMWDTHSQDMGDGASCGGQRAFGGAAFDNPDHLTTALGIDDYDFVWIFNGLVAPPPATVEQQIAEIIRLLLTPEGLRCSGLDQNPGNGRIEDDPISFPNGAFVDPVSPQVTSGEAVTGDETVDDLRSAGFRL